MNLPSRGDDTKVRKLSGSRCSRAQQFELEHDFQGASEVAKVAVYRKALFRDRNQTIKRTLFTLEPRPDALRGVFQPLNRRKFTLNALNCPIWVSLEPDNSDTFVSLPQHVEDASRGWSRRSNGPSDRELTALIRTDSKCRWSLNRKNFSPLTSKR
jgi:hypothetical protein